MVQRLRALHAQAVALAMQLEGMIAESEAQPIATACTHPPDKREKVSTLADTKPRYRCRECGQENV